MANDEFERAVFINCPFDEAYAHLLEAATFCVVYFGFIPRLANERVESGENRLDKIVDMIKSSKYSIHDLSRCRTDTEDRFFRMNMPFEFGLDVGLRRSGNEAFRTKKFLIFEERQYDLKRALSDVAGQDVDYHHCEYDRVIKMTRNFFRVEVKVDAPGAARIISDYATFQGWMTEKKLFEGHSEEEAMNLPTRERLDEMRVWVTLGKPMKFYPAMDDGLDPN